MEDTQERTAKVLEVVNVRPHTNDHGTTYYYTLKMDNGDVGDIGKKKENFFSQGTSLTYTIERKGNYVNFKEVRNFPAGGSGGGRPAGPAKTNKQTALECASRIFLERNRVNPVETETAKIADGIITIARKFETYLSE